MYDFLLEFFSNIVPIFDFENAVTLKTCRDIEIGVRGHSRSLKEVPFYTPGMLSY